MRTFVMITQRASSEYTEVALSSFLANTPLAKDDLFILIDNDGSLPSDWCVPHPTFRLIRNHSPMGFAENMNQGISQMRGEEVLLLNNDLVFPPNWLGPLMLGGKTISSPLSNREINYTTDVFNTGVEMNLGYYKGREEGFVRLAQEHQRHNQGILNVLSFPFFCTRIPAQVIERVGLLDESFGRGGGEDYDYALRAIEQGFSLCYALSSYVLHFGGKSTWSGVESEEQQRERERIFFKRFLEKWGEQLLEIILKENVRLILDNDELRGLSEQGRLQEVVSRLKPGVPPVSGL